MATTVEIYNSTAAAVMASGTTANFKIILVDNTYTFNAAHSALADVSASEITGTGYTTGGALLSNLAASVIDGVDPDGAMIDADDVVWNNLTATFRRAILYVDATIGGVVKPVLLSYLLDDTPNDITVTNTDYKLTINAQGLVKSSWV